MYVKYNYWTVPKVYITNLIVLNRVIDLGAFLKSSYQNFIEHVRNQYSFWWSNGNNIDWII